MNIVQNIERDDRTEETHTAHLRRPALTPYRPGFSIPVVNAGPIPDLLSIVILAWLAGLATLIAFSMLAGRVMLNGLFTTDIDNDGVADEFHPERVQLLLFSVFGIAAYVFATMDAVAASKTALTVLPDVPDELLMMLGASNTFYLSGKF